MRISRRDFCFSVACAAVAQAAGRGDVNIDSTLFADSRQRRVLVTDERISLLRRRIARRVEPTYSAWLDLQRYVREHEDHTASVPARWYVPGYYRDSEGHRRAKAGLMEDANTAYAFALYCRLSGQERYGRAAADIISAWTTGLDSISYEDDSTLSFSYHFPAMIYAADLIERAGLLSEDQDEAFRVFLRQKALTLSTIKARNNWGNWGLLLSVSVAAYVHDAALAVRCVRRWKEFIGEQIAEDGHLHHEVRRNGGRSGLWYSHFSLMPQTLAAEVLRVNGVDVFDYVAPNGRSLRSAFVRLADWSRRPETFPYWDGPTERLSGRDYYSYFEILVAHWPDENAKALLRRSRPMTARHSAPLLTLTHGDPLDAADATRA